MLLTIYNAWFLKIIVVYDTGIVLVYISLHFIYAASHKEFWNANLCGYIRDIVRPALTCKLKLRISNFFKMFTGFIVFSRNHLLLSIKCTLKDIHQLRLWIQMQLPKRIIKR